MEDPHHIYSVLDPADDGDPIDDRDSGVVVADIPRAHSNLGYPILVDLKEDWDHMEAHMEVDYPVQVV